MISGFQKVSLVDYPGHICSVIFIGGCNMRCQYCHNGQLVKKPQEEYLINDILDYLKQRKNLIDGVCISGGEPTLSELSFIKDIKILGLKIKLDTNGTNPKKIKELLPLLDYVAMDIKAPLDKYELITQKKIDTSKILSTISLLKSIQHEFRTTIQPDLLSPEDIVEIAKLVNDSKLVLQNFRPSPNMFNLDLKKSYSKEEALEILNQCQKYTKTSLRGF